MHDYCVSSIIIFIACESHKTDLATTHTTTQHQSILIFFTSYHPPTFSSAADLVFHPTEPTPTFGLGQIE